MSDYLGDFAPGVTLRCRFNTHTAAGTPITLAGSPAVAAYRDSTTEGTTGVTLTVDYDARTGLHQVAVDTSADATFFAKGNDFDVVLTAGTVDGVSIAGTKLASFSILNRLTAGFRRAVQSIVTGTVGSGSTTTSVVTSAVGVNAGAADSWKGRILTFAEDTTTAALRNQSTDITANTSGATPTLTVTALTTAPASGDIFTVQ
jgi:hypothetical protein